jgi:hypothetical protein
MPNSNSSSGSDSSLPNDNPSLPNLPNGIGDSILISPVVNNYQVSLMFV